MRGGEIPGLGPILSRFCRDPGLSRDNSPNSRSYGPLRDHTHHVTNVRLIAERIASCAAKSVVPSEMHSRSAGGAPAARDMSGDAPLQTLEKPGRRRFTAAFKQTILDKTNQAKPRGDRRHPAQARAVQLDSVKLEEGPGRGCGRPLDAEEAPPPCARSRASSAPRAASDRRVRTGAAARAAAHQATRATLGRRVTAWDRTRSCRRSAPRGPPAPALRT